MADEKKKKTKEEEKIGQIAQKLSDELTFGSSLGRYWFVYLLGTLGGAGLGALLGWSTGRLLELADWLGLSIGGAAGAVVGFGSAAGVTRALDKNVVGAVNRFALEAEKAMRAQELKFNNELVTMRTNLKNKLKEELNIELDSVRDDVEALESQLEDDEAAEKKARKEEEAAKKRRSEAAKKAAATRKKRDAEKAKGRKKKKAA